MISAIKVLRGEGSDPYRNLALEKCLTGRVRDGECILFLWQNRDTVVIGRNQNAWEECRAARFREGKGFLARRLSGGGAVYHDLGNLNYSFLVRKEDRDTERETEVILRAVRRMGVPAERTGRNDLEAEGRKFSGCAFYEQGGRCCHHGTLMIDVDLDRMEELLTPSGAKLRSRGIASVRSRVVNLKTFLPGLDRTRMETALLEAFGEVYGLKAEPLEEDRLEEGEIRAETAVMASGEWILGRHIPFTASFGDRFPWGSIRVELHADRGRILDAACWSDAMEEALIRRVGLSLRDAPYDGEEMARRVLEAAGASRESTDPALERMAGDIARMIREQI